MPSRREWTTLCPPEYLEDIERALNNPPGMPGSEKVYGYSLSDEYSDPEFSCNEDGSSPNRRLTAEELKERKRFAEAWGEYAEALVCRMLLEKGYPIREKDWRPLSGKAGAGKGEIDIITQKGDRIIFVEVKARYGTHYDPWKSMTSQKIKRLCHGADVYLKMQRENFEYQFDVALITGSYLENEIEYIEDAFLAPLRTTR